DEYPDIPEFPLSEKLLMEKEATGLYISGHPMDEYRQNAKAAGCVGIGQLLEELSENSQGLDGKRVSIAGMITSVKRKRTKTNSIMAYVGMEDETGSIELIVFPSVLEKHSNVLTEKNAALVKGRVSVREEKEPQIVCDSAMHLRAGALPGTSAVLKKETIEAKPSSKKGKLYIRVPSSDSHEYKKLKAILNMFPGDEKTVIFFADTRQCEKLGAMHHELLLSDLEELYGKENVVLS
ncbi:MAG: DNA polymerase III subunit alpha, partial [Oscillospiraceae bacterium]|nr:DNA polymerase III subunit alpha [Oscillospiraceae bacterium]